MFQTTTIKNEEIILSAALLMLDGVGAERVAIFGTGKHSLEACAAFAVHQRPEIVAFIKDNAQPGDKYFNWPCVKPEECPDGLDAILVSTDAYEKCILAKWSGYFAQKGIALLGLYCDAVYLFCMQRSDGKIPWNNMRNAFYGRKCYISGKSHSRNANYNRVLKNEHKLLWGDALASAEIDDKTLGFIFPGESNKPANIITNYPNRIYQVNKISTPDIPFIQQNISTLLPAHPVFYVISMAAHLGFRAIYVVSDSVLLESPEAEVFLSYYRKSGSFIFSTSPSSTSTRTSSRHIPFQDTFNARKPYHIIIQPTNRCNMRCSMCPGPRPPYADLSMKLFTKILAELRPYSPFVRKFELCGGIGEPTINKNIFDMIAAARTEGYRHIGVFTNGVTLEEQGENLIKAGLTHISVSFYGSCPEIFRKYHLTGDYDKIKQGILKLLAYRNKTDSQLKVSLRYSPMDENKEDLLLYIDQWRGLVDEIVSRPLHNCNENKYDNLVHYKRAAACSQPFIAVNITSDGDVVGCCINTLNLMRLGNIKRHSLRDIYESPEFDQWRRARLEGSCKNCSGANPPEWIIN